MRPESQLLSYIQNNDRKGVVVLLKQHSDLIHKWLNAEGHTALIVASLKDHRVLVELLLLHGANPRCVDEKGNTPFDHASIKEHPKVLEILEKPRFSWRNLFFKNINLMFQCIIVESEDSNADIPNLNQLIENVTKHFRK